MLSGILEQLELVLRLIVAGVCGCLIGYERKNRLKEAGVRTHIIVALGAALIMVISKYAFQDGYSDPTRIASQIVSGIGFLGAGMIFVKKQAISGLTTAAGVWTTAGIGMAIGAKLYFIGTAATVLVLVVQVLLHRNYKWFHLPMSEQVNITFSESNDSISYVQEKFAQHNIEIINLKAEKLGNGLLEVELYVKLPHNFDISKLMDLFKDNPHIKSIEF